MTPAVHCADEPTPGGRAVFPWALPCFEMEPRWVIDSARYCCLWLGFLLVTQQACLPMRWTRLATVTRHYSICLESVRKHQAGLQSFRSMRRIEASRRNARALRLRFSQSLTSLRQRLSQAKVRSTTQRRGSTTNPFV